MCVRVKIGIVEIFLTDCVIDENISRTVYRNSLSTVYVSLFLVYYVDERENVTILIYMSFQF